MLTNKIISVLIILTSFLFASCWMTNAPKNDKKIEQISWEWKKGKSIWWNVKSNKGDSTSIYSWSTELPKWKPKNIK